ncbi:hypothetical protein HJC23_012927 [Cyclotella cryptica]|uniref:Uncharacterized protein n=1 Tax=Cyclotella cryptica TaxID=29204 RepID=A0ABD3Q2K0_9STRA|eukprot:CCRYP_009278-RA/>CCRYP_009278-RA protein AED:0.31 eAED:0.31 QI:0/-1/0/1/-1/1/1/0/917
MEPPIETEHPRRSSSLQGDPPDDNNEGQHDRTPGRMPCDPESCTDPPAAPIHWMQGRAQRPAFVSDDDHLEDYELEGLMMTRLPNGVGTTGGGTDRSITYAATVRGAGSRAWKSVTSSVGAGGRKSNNTPRSRIEVIAVRIMAACSLAWDPRNRARSCIGVLFVTFLLLILFSKKDVSEWHRIDLTDEENKRIDDPLADLTPEQRHTLLSSIYGTWTFFDGSAEDRPTEPYLTVEKADIYLDMKGEDFPEDSWQVDAVYVNHFLDAATKLVRRGQEAIFATYHGHGLVNVTVDDGDVHGVVVNPEERMNQRLDMFRLAEIDLSSTANAKELSSSADSWEKRGGWTTSRSLDGLERRLLHAMMTNSNFTVVVTGSWQSMGYGGNHGWQSMAGVLDHLLSGLFEKLGMKLVVRGIGLPPMSGINTEEQAEMLLGGRSTLESSMGWSSIYGSDVDMVVWDDYSAVKNEHGEYSQDLDDTAAQLFDFFARQALLSGRDHLPFIWGGDFEILRNLHELADADIGQLGNGMIGIPGTTSKEMAGTLPWAAQFLNCPPEMQQVCEEDDHKFSSQCWAYRSDSRPSLPQLNEIPVLPTAIGWRMHQVKAYTLGYNVLAALLDALNTWSEKTIYEGHPLADEYWHMGEYITNVQSKVQSLTEENSPHCYMLSDKLKLPKRLCNRRLKGRTEYTPRSNPTVTSLKSVIVPSASGNLPVYDLQSVFVGEIWENPIADVPAHAVDALEILDLKKQRRRDRPSRRLDAIQSGDGWRIHHSYPEDDCDGSYTPWSSCGRVSTSTCLMEAHHGSRGFISGDQTTGWLSMMISGMEFGYVAVNLKIGDLGENKRSLADVIPDTFSFDYAVDDVTASLDKSQFLEKLEIFNGISLFTIFDDENKSSEEVKISLRVNGCSKEEGCQLAVSHLYWC